MGEKLTVDAINELIERSKEYDKCMMVSVCEEGQSVELVLDTSISHYTEWIKGEGADIHLLISFDTDKVIGVRLPLMDKKLAVFYDGPIKINEGYKKEISTNSKGV